MIKCVNSKCNKDADNLNRILVTCDGDFACSEECKKIYEKERDHFFNHVVQSEENFLEWFNK